MASPTQWTWVWVNSGSWWWTGMPGVLWSMGLQRAGHYWVLSDWTELIAYMHPIVLLTFGESNGNPLQYSCLENPIDRGAWWAAVLGVARSWTRLSDFTLFFHFNALEKEMATHSSVLAWRIPGTGEPGGLPSMGLYRVGHNWSDLAAAAAAAAAADFQLGNLGLNLADNVICLISWFIRSVAAFPPHYFIHCVCESYSVVSNSGNRRLLYPWNYLGKNTGLGCHFLF